jgi:hypothetical protein
MSKNRKNTNENNKYIDIYDSNLYKRFAESEANTSQMGHNEITYSFTINTDGISRCNKSKLQIWPVYLVLNELPLNVRFCIENIIVAGKEIFLIVYQFIYLFFELNSALLFIYKD